MSKKYILGLCFVFLLTGCFGGGEEVTREVPENYTEYEVPAFSIHIPDNWKVIEPKDFSDEIPHGTQIAFHSNVKSDIFTTNANIAKRLLTSPQTSMEFARSSIGVNKENLMNYREVARDDKFNILIGEEIEKTILILFEGKLRETDPTVRFIQTYAVKGADAYTITAAYSGMADEFEIEAAENIVKSFKIN